MPETTTPGQRFVQLIQQLGLSKNAFAQSLGKTATVIQHLVDERNKPGFDLLSKVLEVYPNVSSDWLLLGQGPMLRSEMPTPLFAEAAPPPRPAPAPGGIDLSEVPDVSRRRQGNLLQPADVAATLRLAGPARNGSNGHSAPVATKEPVATETPKPAAPATFEPKPAEATAAPAPLAAPAAVLPITQPAPAAPVLPDPAYLASLFQTQQLQHQLALAEQRNQHLLEQQALLQQMVQLLQRTV